MLLLGKIEMELNASLENKLYCHYYTFSRFLSLLNSYDQFSKNEDLKKKQKEYLEFSFS